MRRFRSPEEILYALAAVMIFVFCISMILFIAYW
jgi:hypothetical protein